MAYVSDDSPTRGFSARPRKLDFAPGDDGWEDDRPPRDIKKLLLVIGLGGLSWVATYVGILELIQANTGDLPLTHKVIIGFSVAMLMTMIVWLLDQIFAPIGAFTRLFYITGYLFLTAISVGFGFGFYWKVLESRTEASRSAASAVGQVQDSLHAASTRMEQLQATLLQLSTLSREKAELERTKGTSCPNSRPGDGPRRRLREADAAKFSFASDFVRGRVSAVKAEIGKLDTDLARVVMSDKSTFDPKTGTRNTFMRGLSRRLDMTVTGFNAFRTDPQLKQMRSDLSDRAGQTTFGDPNNGGFSCPDPQLQAALRGAVRAIDQLPNLRKPEIAVVEGPEATIEAFRRLSATAYGAMAFKLPPSADELRDLQKRAVQSAETQTAEQRALIEAGGGLSQRDYVPFSIAIFVDFCLLLVSMGRPMNRLHGLMPKMREAERGPVIQILSRFNEIHRDPQIRQNFELFRHVVFDWHGDYYVAVPLHAPTRYAPKFANLKQKDLEDLEHEAHLLANLFTSFEKERIFKRVYNPLLNTRSIQKRLERQGSKFSGVDAFRIYRFRDGAWSEIILGAIMGAARRVEAEQQRQSIEREIFRRRDPDLADVMARTAFDESDDDDTSLRFDPKPPRRSFWRRSQEQAVPEPVAEPDVAEEVETVAVRPDRKDEADDVMHETVKDDVGVQERSAAVDGDELVAEWEPVEEFYSDDRLKTEEDYRAKYGPYAAHVASQQTELDFEDEADAAEDQSGQASAEEVSAEPLGRGVGDQPDTDAHAEKTIDVVLTRETATVSVPTAEAAIQHSLAAMARKTFIPNHSEPRALADKNLAGDAAAGTLSGGENKNET